LMGGGVADGGVTTAKLADEAVTLPKLLHIATDSFLGRDTAGTGDVEVLTATQVRTIINVENNAAADQTAGEIESIVDHDNLLGFVGAEHIDWAASGAEDLDSGRSLNGVLALTSGEVTQLANIGATVIQSADWVALAALVGVNTGDQTITLTGQVEGSGQGSFAASLGTTAISAQSELAGGLAATDELLISDAGTLKRMDVSVMDAYFNAALSFASVAHTHTGSTISDLDAADTTTGAFADARIPNLNASKINAGEFTDARIPGLDASKIDAGTFLDARIAASNVTQHEASLDHDNLLNFVAEKHIRWDLTGGENVHADRYTNTIYTHPTVTVRSINTSGATVIDLFDSNNIGSVTNITTRVMTLGDLGAAAAVHSHTGSTISDLATGDTTSGTFINARISASSVTQHAITLTGGDGINTIGLLNVGRTVSVDGTVVRTTGTQTISGQKTFASPIRAPNGSAAAPSFVTGDIDTGMINGGTNINHWSCGNNIRMTLSAAGALVCDADITAFSDERLKTDFKVIKNALDKIAKVSGYTFMRKDHFDTDTGESLDTRRHAGVKAQEIQRILPEVISANDDGILGTAYGNMAALFIEAIKELMNRVEELEFQTATVAP